LAKTGKVHPINHGGLIFTVLTSPPEGKR